MKTLFFERNNKKIVYYVWDDVEEIKGVVLISHGMAEHAKRYNDIAMLFNKEGYVVYADDHRGHGETDKNNLGYSEQDMAQETVFDMSYLIDIIKKEYSNKKVVLFGFSYGSFLTQKFLENYSYKIDGVIIGGTSKQNKCAVKFGRFVTRLNLMFNKKTKPAYFIKKMTFDVYDRKFEDGCFLSTSKSSNNKYFNDVYCSFVCSYNFYNSFFKLLDSLYTKQYAKNLNKDLKVLIVSGQDDAVGNMGKGPKRLYEYYKKVGMNNVVFKLYPNSRHEFLNEELGKNRALDLIKFCNEI